MVRLSKVIGAGRRAAVDDRQRALDVSQRPPGSGVAVDVDLAAAFDIDVALGSRERGAGLQGAAVQFDRADQFRIAAVIAERGVAHHFDGRRAGIADDDVAVKIGTRRRQD